MRTKTLLITAALGLAGVATSMAQVYSVNAVGYINLTLRPGFNMVANQLTKTPNNGLNNVITGGLVAESQALKFDNAANNYVIEFYSGTAWVKDDGVTPGTMVVNPGDGFFIFNADTANATVTLVGEVPQGTGLNVTLNPGFSLVSSIVPQQIQLTQPNGFPQIAEAQYLVFNAATQNYDAVIFNNGTNPNGWVLEDGVTPANPVPAPAVGQGFFYFNPETSVANWTRNFSVN
jgi:hypothetical protein